MSTRSVIAVPTDNDWKGRYVHWDGYPSHMGAQLTAIIQRDGYEKAVKVLTEDHKSWSGISTEGSYDEFGGIAVPGYGAAHNDIPEGDDPWIYPGNQDWTEYVYLLLPFGIAVYKRSNDKDGDIFVGLFDWQDELDWGQIELDINERLERV